MVPLPARRKLLPVSDDVQRGQRSLGQNLGQETLAVRGGTIAEVVAFRNHMPRLQVEQSLGNSGLERPAWARSHRNRHESRVTQVIEFLSIGTPARFLPAAVRYPRGCAAGGKRAHVDLVLSGFIRNIGDPVPIRRELALALVELGLEKRDRAAR